MSSEKDVTVSLIAPSVHNLLHEALEVKPLDSDLGIQMKDAMKADLGSRYQDTVVKNFLHIASLLDPRFRILHFCLMMTEKMPTKILKEKLSGLKKRL